MRIEGNNHAVIRQFAATNRRPAFAQAFWISVLWGPGYCLKRSAGEADQAKKSDRLNIKVIGSR
jgi:hypothetical protein